MVLAGVFFIIGLIILIASAEALVRGASSLASALGITPMVIGLTVVAFGTSAPEFVVTFLSALSGSSDIGLGNIIGSNIANILLILGVASILNPLRISHGTVWKEVPFALLAVILIFIMGNDTMIDNISPSTISRSEGLTLAAFFIIFMYYIFGIAKSQNNELEDDVVLYRKSIALALAVGGIIFWRQTIG